MEIHIQPAAMEEDSSADASARPIERVPSLPRVFADMPHDFPGDDFCCIICTELLLRPVTMACGHTVCLHCLSQWFSQQADDKVCPQCRQNLNQVDIKQCAVNIQMEAIVSSCFPERSTQRALAHAETIEVLNRERRERLLAEHIRSSQEEDERVTRPPFPPSPPLRGRRQRHRAQNGVFPLTVLLTRAIASCVTKTITAPLERLVSQP